jgi:transcriptional regulator with XRE-family HTH domain
MYMSPITETQPTQPVNHNLIAARHARGLTQTELAAAASLCRATVQNIESGRSRATKATRALLCAALDLPQSELFEV